MRPREDFDPESPLSDLFLTDPDYLGALLGTGHDIDIDEPLENIAADLRKFAEPNAPLFSENLDVPDSCKTFRALYRNLIRQLGEIYGDVDTECIGYKQTWVEALVPGLLSSESTLSCVHVIRDPRSIIASWKQADMLTHDYPFLMMIRHWRKSAALAALSLRKDRYLVVRYEDFVADPRCYVERICRTIGLPFHEESLEISSYRDGKGGAWRSNTTYEQGEDLSSSYVDRWKDRLEESEVALIEHLCETEMKYFGYACSVERRGLEVFDTPPTIGRSVKGETEWISRYQLQYEMNALNMSQEAARWAVAESLRDASQSTLTSLGSALFISPDLLTGRYHG